MRSLARESIYLLFPILVAACGRLGYEPEPLDASSPVDASPPVDAFTALEPVDAARPDADRDEPRRDAGRSGCTPGVNLGRRYLYCADAVTRNDAAIRCANLGMRLVRIDDASEQAFLSHLRLDSRAWIGATDETRESAWTWNDGTLFFVGSGAAGRPVNGSYVRWAPTQPDGARRENCAMLLEDDTWADEDCTLSAPYLCESL